MRPNRVSDSILVKPWIKDKEKSYFFSRSAWSLYAIAQFRKRITRKSNVCIWFPGYFCNASIAPLREQGIKIIFYPLSRDGKPDLTACNEMLYYGRPDLVVAVHYFGEEIDYTHLAEFVRECDAWLVEDSTHVLRPENGCGDYGDFVLYSPHKHLPIPDGALLIVRTDSAGGITDDLLEDFDFNGLYNSILDMNGSSEGVSYKWLLKRVLQILGARSTYSTALGFYEGDYVMEAKQFLHPKMSSLSRKLLAAILDDLHEEALNRRSNQAAWVECLKNNEEIDKCMIPLSGIYVPYLAGFNFSHKIITENTYKMMIKAGIPVTTWPDLPAEVQNDPVRQKVAISMRDTRLFFPVHHSVNPLKIQLLLKTIAHCKDL